MMDMSMNLNQDGDETEAEVKERRCLMCRETFDSAWAGERICRRCRSSAAWRRG
jgi:hypothetical protein